MIKVSYVIAQPVDKFAPWHQKCPYFGIGNRCFQLIGGMNLNGTKNRILRTTMLALLLLVLACNAKQEEPDLLLGTWKVFYINRGGMIIAGRAFKGTEYTFRENGTVFAEAISNEKHDTLTTRYERHHDTLVYLAIGSRAREEYHLDSLTATRLVISANNQEIPTEIRMLKLQK